MQSFYLAGGTGAALQLGHRISEDFDFFTQRRFKTPTLLQRVARVGAAFDLQTEAEGTLVGVLGNARVSFFLYSYPLLKRTQTTQGIRVASLIDIGLMKLTAVSQRGSRRDFVDLFAICREAIPLKELLSLLPKKYGGINYSLPHLLRSLVFFDDAEAEPMPKMLQPTPWKTIVRFFEREVGSIAHAKL